MGSLRVDAVMVGVCCYLVLFFVVVLAAVRWGVNSLAAVADEDAATIRKSTNPSSSCKVA
jgi:hypothetical protein